MRARPPSHGSVLVVVLVMIAFAVVMLTRLIESGSSDLLLAMRQADRERLRGDAHAALETTLAVLADFRAVDGGLYAPAQGWSDPLGYAGYVSREGVSLEVGFEDESGKLSLPTVSFETLKTLLAREGLAASDAARVADALFSWMRSGYIGTDSASRAGAYAWQALPLTPPLRSPRSFEELASIAVAGGFFYEPDGTPKPLLGKFRELVSLYQFGATNLNAAPAEVLMASGWDATQAAELQKRRAAPDGRKTKPYFRTAQEAGGSAGGLGASIQLLRINVTARQGAAQLRLSALVTWDKQAVLPPPIVRREPAIIARTAGEPAAAAAPVKAEPAAPKDGDLHYPFTILELSESALPAPASEHEPAA